MIFTVSQQNVVHEWWLAKWWRWLSPASAARWAEQSTPRWYTCTCLMEQSRDALHELTLDNVPYWQQAHSDNQTSLLLTLHSFFLLGSHAVPSAILNVTYTRYGPVYCTNRHNVLLLREFCLLTVQSAWSNGALTYLSCSCYVPWRWNTTGDWSTLYLFNVISNRIRLPTLHSVRNIDTEMT